MKRSINLINGQTVLTYVVIAALIHSVVVGGSILIDGLGYSDPLDLILMGIAFSIIFPSIILVASPKGELKIDVVDGDLEVILESHNFIFKCKPQHLIIENGSTYKFVIAKSGRYDTTYKLQSGESAIFWKASSADYILKKTLFEYFANLGTETEAESYIFTNDITLEPKSEVKSRNFKRRILKSVVCIVILVGIVYQLLHMYRDYRYEQQAKAEIEQVNNLLQENYGTDLEEVLGIDM